MTRHVVPKDKRSISSSVKPVNDMTTTRIFLLSTISPIVTFALLKIVTSTHHPFRIPLFDASSSLLLPEDHSGLRWDAIHFSSIATKGYEYEQQLAFQPGWQGVLWFSGWLWTAATGDTEHLDAVVRGSTVLMVILAGWRGTALYQLTSRVFNKRFAYLTTIMYLFAPTPAVLVSPYTEPLYACLTFTGFHQAFKRRYVLASIFLAGATSLRATGVFAAPVLAAMALFPDGKYHLSTRILLLRALSVAIPCLLVVTPLLLFQYYVYLSFCVPNPTRPWCHYRLPFSYSYVQAEYWYIALLWTSHTSLLISRNIGFLNYWTPAQIPNLLIASPVLATSIFGIFRYVTSQSSLPRSAMPLVIHHAVMTFLLIFGSHTQISLRVVSTDPVFWWLLTDIAFKRGAGGMTRAGKAWVWWSVIWGAVSIVLWAGHYPPA